jgi:hypothetical protein
MKAGNPIDDNDHIPLDMDESDGEEYRKSYGTANGVAATAGLHDAEEIGYCFDPDMGAPEPTHVEIGGMKAAMAS